MHTINIHTITGCDRPALKYLNRYVRREVSSKWHDLGLELLEPEDEGSLKSIKRDNRNDVEECCKEMFQLWLDKCPEASWDQLIRSLRQPSVGLNHLALKLEQMLTPTEGESCMPHALIATVAIAM